MSSRLSYISLTQVLTLALSSSAIIACEEEVKPNPPTFIARQAKLTCSRMGGQSYLKQLSFVAEDLDGADTLRPPSVELGALSLPLSEELIPAPTGEERSELAGTEDTTLLQCSHESCRVRYTWDYSAEAGQISCGDAGDALLALIAISDENGQRATAQLRSTFE